MIIIQEEDFFGVVIIEVSVHNSIGLREYTYGFAGYPVRAVLGGLWGIGFLVAVIILIIVWVAAPEFWFVGKKQTNDNDPNASVLIIKLYSDFALIRLDHLVHLRHHHYRRFQSNQNECHSKYGSRSATDYYCSYRKYLIIIIIIILFLFI